MSESRDNYYRLGQALGSYDPEATKFTPAAIGNLMRAPTLNHGFMRQHSRLMLDHPVAGPLLAAVEWEKIEPIPRNQDAFWFGYYKGRGLAAPTDLKIHVPDGDSDS